jgi:putative transposase
MVAAGRRLGDRLHQRADLATNALGMAINSRNPAPGAIIHGDHGTQFTSWTFTERARKAGLLPSLGTIGDPCDNAVIESFWGRMQTELLNRQRWGTRVELANAIFEYIEGFHHRRRRHSALAWQTPLEFETTAINRAPAPQIAVHETGS